jgi:hypothetical protein
MKLMTRARAGYVITLVAGIAIGCVAVGSAAAVQSGPTPKLVTHHYALAASAFAPDGSTDVYGNFWDPTTLTVTSGCVNAGLSLPPSVTLKSITFYYTRGTTGTLYAELNRQNLTNHTDVQVIKVNSVVAPTRTYSHITKSIPKADSTVNNGTYAYSIGVCPHGNATFSGLIITYTTTA